MNYEKRIKDLMARLVSMSPEPPPYPEEMPMARHQEEKKSRPVLVFAAAVAFVALLAVPLLLFTGDGNPVAVPSTTTSTSIPQTSTTAATPESTTTVAEMTTTTSSTTESTEVLEATWESIVFLFQSPENSFLGNPALVPVWIRVTDPTGNLQPDDHFTEALQVAGELPPGLETAVPPEVQILDVSSQDGDGWVVDMNEAFLAGAGGLLADVTMLNQIIYTVTYGTPEFEEVRFTVGGQPVSAYGSEGIDLTDPVTRETFIDDVNLIFLTEPVLEANGVYTVAGRANTFEASLVVHVLDGEGTVVHEEFLTATCGSGCWGEFSTEIDAALIEPGVSSVEVFQSSPEDGSQTNVITVPVPDGDIWALTADG